MNYSMLKKVQYVLLMLLMIGSMPKVFGQCEAFENFPEGAKKGRQMHVLYRDYVKKKQYNKALPLWTKLMKYSPAGSVLHYIDGVTMQSYLYEQTEDEAKKAEIAEKIIKLYDQRMACFGEKRKDKGYVTAMKAYDMYALQYDDAKTLATFAEAVEIEGNKTEAYILSAYADHATYMFSSDLIGKEAMKKLYKQLLAIVDANVDNKDFIERRAEIQGYFELDEDGIFDCEYFKAKKMKEYKADPDNPKVFRAVLRYLFAKGCNKEDEFMKELMVKDAKFVIHIDRNPSYKNPIHDAYRKGDIEGALVLYEQAIDETESADKKASIQYRMAQIYYAKKKNRSKAREYALKAAKNRSGWGKPYMLIGNMYASSGSICGNGRDWNSQIVVWSAIDMWQKAKSVDPSIKEEADRQIFRYKKYMPNKEDGFQRNIKEGQSVKIECWIQTTTTARFTNKY